MEFPSTLQRLRWHEPTRWNTLSSQGYKEILLSSSQYWPAHYTFAKIRAIGPRCLPKD